jgi:hypothetical protein
MMTAFVSMFIAMGMVTIVAILVPKAFLFTGIVPSISFRALFGPGDEPFKLSTIEPDTPANLANIYGDTIAVLFFKSRFVASWTNHMDSFLF